MEYHDLDRILDFAHSLMDPNLSSQSADRPSTCFSKGFSLLIHTYCSLFIVYHICIEHCKYFCQLCVFMKVIHSYNFDFYIPSLTFVFLRLCIHQKCMVAYNCYLLNENEYLLCMVAYNDHLIIYFACIIHFVIEYVIYILR